jgi:predicted secreted hydrolase
MNKGRLAWLLAAGVSIAAIVLGMMARLPPASPQAQANLFGLAVPSGTFARADLPRSFSFPADMGPHNDFQTEWWYYTGNLSTADGRPFGFELTFFRHALLGPSDVVARPSAWGTSQVYLAHFAVTDIAGGQFHAFERYERAAAELSGAQGAPSFRVWLQGWAVQQTGDRGYHLTARQGSMAVDLTLQDRTGPVLEGVQGYSQKGPAPGQASYYFSQPRLDSQGTVTVGGTAYTVTGTAWMDHEFSTTALGADQVGWDWFSIQLNDGTELMAYTLRRLDGSLDPFSSGTVISQGGQARRLAMTDFKVSATATWKSPHSGGTYPAAWTLSVPSEGLTLYLKPRLADQELNVSFIYWEGAVRVDGERNGTPVAGTAYVELTGYAQSLQGRF